MEGGEGWAGKSVTYVHEYTAYLYMGGWVSCLLPLPLLCSLFQWSVPFCGWLCVSALMVAIGGLYFIPPRFLVLAWGENDATHTTTPTQACMCPCYCHSTYTYTWLALVCISTLWQWPSSCYPLFPVILRTSPNTHTHHPTSAVCPSVVVAC